MKGTATEVTNGPALSLRSRLVLGTALATSAFVGGYRGYVGRAFADCIGAGGTYTCSGLTTTTQALTGEPLTVTTVPGFAINASEGGALNLEGVGGLTFTDGNLSPITGVVFGINAFNYGGELSITTSGVVTATTVTGSESSADGVGIYALNFGTDLTIVAGGVSGASNGINARNGGSDGEDESGVLSITTTGTVTGADGDGIDASNYGTNLTITAAGVGGADNGIQARNYGSGVLSITTTGTVTGTNGDGIFARNFGTNLTITAAGVSGTYNGIDTRNYGSGALSITTTGVVTGTGTVGSEGFYGGAGIYALNEGTSLTIVAEDANGGIDGIQARSYGSGALSITATGSVTGDSGTGIYAANNSASASSTTTVTVESGAAVSGATAGVELVSTTGRAAIVDNAGSIAGATGILASTSGSVTITNAGSITGNGGTAIDLIAAGGPNSISQRGGTINGNILLSANGDVVGVPGGRILGNINGNDGNDLISVSGGSITGNIVGGGGIDQVNVSAGSLTGSISAESVRLTGGTIGGDITGISGDTLIIDGTTVDPIFRNGVVFSGTNATAMIINADLAVGGTRTQVFQGFDTVTVDPSTIGFGTGTIGIGQLNLLDNSTLFVNGNATMTGNASVVNSTIDMLNGAANDVFTLGGLTLNSAQLRIDVNQQALQADQIAATTLSATGSNGIVVNLLGTPNFSGQTQIPIIVSASGIPPGAFSVQPVPGTAGALFLYDVVAGPNGGLFLLISPGNFGIAVAPQAAVNSGIVGTALDAFEGIIDDAIASDLGLAVSSQGVQISPTVGVFASGQFAHTQHDGFTISSAGFSGAGPDFDVDEFSAAISIDFNAAKHFQFDKQYGLNLGLFGGYASADVAHGAFRSFDAIGDGINKSGMFGGYGLFRSGFNYALVATTAFLGNTDISNRIFNSKGSYDTQGYGLTGSVGRIFVLNDQVRFDLRGGLLGVVFNGDDFVDSAGNQFGDSRISFGAVKFEPGVYADYKLDNGMVLSPYARVDLQQRFGYTNYAGIGGQRVDFEDADFSAAAMTGFNLKMSEMATMSAEVRGKFSADSSTLAGKLGLKIAF